MRALLGDQPSFSSKLVYQRRTYQQIPSPKLNTQLMDSIHRKCGNLLEVLICTAYATPVIEAKP